MREAASHLSSEPALTLAGAEAFTGDAWVAVEMVRVLVRGRRMVGRRLIGSHRHGAGGPRSWGRVAFRVPRRCGGTLDRSAAHGAPAAKWFNADKGYGCSFPMRGPRTSSFDRIPNEAAFAKLCGVAPRQRAAAERPVDTASVAAATAPPTAPSTSSRSPRMRHHEPTAPYFARRTAEGLTKREIIRCLKRYIAREVFVHSRTSPTTPWLARLTDIGASSASSAPC